MPTPSNKLKETLKGVVNPHKSRPPLWQGPESDTENGGITFSMLSRFIVCRERFRVHYMEGWRPAPSFNHRIEFGNMWHVCEERYAEGGVWTTPLLEYVRGLHQKYPYDADRINNWYGICKVQFPIYVEYWSGKGTGTKGRTVTPLLQEQVFNVPYTLPSGRTVRLRGKWDEVVLIKEGEPCGPCYGNGYYMATTPKNPTGTKTPCSKCNGTGIKPGTGTAGIWVGDHKTKSQIQGLEISRQLTNDLQSLMYLVALEMTYTTDPAFNKPTPKVMSEVWKTLSNGGTIKGMRYNVVKRPSQYQGKKETAQQFQQRLDGIIREEPGEFFARWETAFSPENIARFRKRTLDPLLEQLCDWYSYITANDPAPEEYGYGIHWQMPFGIYNPLLEGGATDLDAYIVEGSTVGLERSESLFEELK